MIFRFSCTAVLIAVIPAAGPVLSFSGPAIDADPVALVNQGDFAKALPLLIERNRQLVAKLPSAGNVHDLKQRTFAVLPLPASPLVSRGRALFEKGFGEYLSGNKPVAVQTWTDAWRLLSQNDDSSGQFDLRRLATTLFVAGLSSGSDTDSVETFNHSLSAVVGQINDLSLPRQTAAFGNQLEIEFELYATREILASIFARTADANSTRDTPLQPVPWRMLLARRKLNDLLMRPGGNVLDRYAWENVFDKVFFSTTTRTTFHRNLFDQCLATLTLADEQYRGEALARIIGLHALLYGQHPSLPVKTRFNALPPSVQERFASEIIVLLDTLTTSGESSLLGRLLTEIEPFCDKLAASVSSPGALTIANAFVVTNRASAGDSFCRTAIQRFAETDQQATNRLRALHTIFLAKAGRFREALALSVQDDAILALPTDEHVLFLWHRSLAYAQAGDSRTSIRDCASLLKLAPHHKVAPDACLGMALQYLNIGDKISARNTLTDYLAQYPDAAAVEFVEKLLSSFQ
jgi:hypothetical protein